ncbi:hypothetical protein GCM10023238_11690 [Streptomyces heliomycini]
MGQVKRVDSAKLAVERAGAEARRAAGSFAGRSARAFFPFPDGLESYTEACVKCLWSSPAARSATNWSSRPAK